MGKQRKAMGKQSLFFNFLCSPQVLVMYNAQLYDALRCLTSVKNEHIHGTSDGHTQDYTQAAFDYAFRIASSVCPPVRYGHLCS